MNPERAVELGKRLRAALDLRGLSQTNLPHMLGIPATQVSDWVRGRHRPSRATRGLIASLLRVREEWLTVGIGAMYKEGGGAEGFVVEAPERYTDPKRLRLIRDVKKLAMEANDDVIDALLKNVDVFKQVPKSRKEGDDK